MLNTYQQKPRLQKNRNKYWIIKQINQKNKNLLNLHLLKYDYKSYNVYCLNTIRTNVKESDSVFVVYFWFILQCQAFISMAGILNSVKPLHVWMSLQMKNEYLYEYYNPSDQFIRTEYQCLYHYSLEV